MNAAIALTEVTVNVTEAHIFGGGRCSCPHCQIGRALAEAFPEADVSANGAAFDLLPWEGPEIRLDLPAEAEDFIARPGDDGEPFTFTVEVPVEALS